MPPPDAVWSTDSRHLGKRVHVHDRLDSTNTLALSLGHDPAQHGLAILAREQTAGRGAVWPQLANSPPAAACLMSVLLFPHAEVMSAVHAL